MKGILYLLKTKSYKIGTRKQTESASCSLGFRHLVAFLGFLLNTLLSLHRQVMSVNIVAMVNHTEAVVEFQNNSTSCAASSEIKDNSKTEGEFHWTPQVQGIIIAASFVGYMSTTSFSGRVAEVWGPKRILLFGCISTATFTAISPWAAWWSPYALIVAQFGRGLSQGFTFTPLYVLMANWFPRNERGFLSAFIMAGFAIGGVGGGSLAGWICDIPELGWSFSFYITSGISAVVILIFALFFYELPHNHPRISKEELTYITQGQENDMSLKRPPVPWGQILRSVPVYALIIGMIGFYWCITYFVAMHATYMGAILKYSMTENGILSSLPFLAMFAGTVLSSSLSMWITSRKILSVDKVRKGCNTISAVGFSVCLLGVISASCDRVINNVCFNLMQFSLGFGLSGTLITSGDMTPIFAGSLASLSSTVSCISAVMPVIVGAMTKHESLEEWHRTFYMHIGIALSTALVFQVFGSAEVQPWNDEQTRSVTENPISIIFEKNYTAPKEAVHKDVTIKM